MLAKRVFRPLSVRSYRVELPSPQASECARPFGEFHSSHMARSKADAQQTTILQFILPHNLARSNSRAGARYCVMLTAVLTQSTSAQTYKVIYSFNGGHSGAGPYSTLAIDKAGNLYGITRWGGSEEGWCGPYGGCGTAYSLRHSGSGWTLDTLYACNETEGNYGRGDESTYSELSIGPDGARTVLRCMEVRQEDATDPAAARFSS